MGIVGIEVRRLYSDEDQKKGSTLRGIASLRQRLVDRASEILATKSAEKFHISLGIPEHQPIRTKDINKIASEIVEAVISSGPEPDPFGARALVTDLPEPLAYLSVTSLDGMPDSILNLNNTFWVGSATPRLVQYGLDQKEAMFSAFPPEFSKRWILLACDGSVQSSSLTLSPELKTETFRTPFHRAFVLDMFGHALELQIRAP